MNSENDFKQKIKDLARGEMNQMHTALPGRVVSYDAGSGRASVAPKGAYKTEDGRSLDFPVIHQVPVCFPTGCGGAVGVTFPVKPGDGGILIFSEQQMDDFLSGGDSDDPRRFALSDAMFVPGLYASADAGALGHPDELCLSYNGYTAVLGAAGFKVTVGGSLISLTPSGFSGNIEGTEFSVGGGDLTVAGISLVHHTHGGVETGGGSTGQPQ